MSSSIIRDAIAAERAMRTLARHDAAAFCAYVLRDERNGQGQHHGEQLPDHRVSVTTASICGLWGNMSIGTTVPTW